MEKPISNNKIWLAETISDCLNDTAHWSEVGQRGGLRRLRRDICCANSNIQQYQCHVPIFSDKPEQSPFFCDVCLRKEIIWLLHKGIKTIGSCCGHGVKQAYIQVSPEYVKKMHELEYHQIPVDEHGNGKWCFEPKSI